MSVVFIVATHGHAAKALLETSAMLIGEQEEVHAVDFVPGENAETLAEKYKAIMAQYDEATEFMFLLDLWGGSPFNAANMTAGQSDKAFIMTGVNVPMLLAAFEARDEGMSLAEIATEVVNGARSGVRALSQTQELFKEQKKVSVDQAQAAAPTQEYTGPNKIGSKEIEKFENPTPFTIGLTRVDDRLIHGQVATVWTKVSNVSRIIVIDDDVAADKIRSSMLKQSTPPGISAHVLDLAKATRVINNPEYAKERFMLLFTNPTNIVRLIQEANWPIKEVNIGGISYKEGKTNLTKAINVGADDVKAIRTLAELGVKLDTRQVANDTSVDLLKLFKDHNL